MHRITRFWRLAASLCASGLLIVGVPAFAQAQNSTSGKCSPIIVSSEVRELRVECPESSPELVKATEAVNRLIRETALTRDQVRELAGLLNEFAGTRTGRNRLAGVMSTWSAAALRNYSQPATQNVAMYFALIDPSDSRFAIGKEPVVFYQIMTADPDMVEANQRCDVSDDASISGFKGSGMVDSTGAMQASMEQLTTADPVFKRLCKGLAAPWEPVMRPGATGPRSGETVYEYLTAGKPGFALALMPGISDGVRIDQIRTYWTGAFAAHVLGVRPNIAFGPEAHASINGAIKGNAPVTMKIDGATNAFRNTSYERPYPPQIVEEFGPELQKMDANWLTYIADASVSVRGRQVRLFEGGKPVPLVHLNRMADLDTPEFWRNLADAGSVLQQHVCLAARFAIAFGYATAGDLPDYGVCGMQLRTR